MIATVVEGRRFQNLAQDSLRERTTLRILIARGGSIRNRDAVCIDKSRSTSKDAVLMLDPARHNLRCIGLEGFWTLETASYIS